MPAVYQTEHPPEVAEVLEEMRRRIADDFGVTLTGNRLTVRWKLHGQLVDVHMIVESVTTPTEAADARRRCEELRTVVAKYQNVAPELAAELFHADTGEWSQ